MSRGNELTQKQESFCLEYFKTGNATQAAITAGYSSKTAASIASVNLLRPGVKARLQELHQTVQDATIADVRERKQILTEIARGNLMDYQEVGADGGYLNIDKEAPNSRAISEITSRTEYDNNGSNAAVVTRVRLHNPVQAIQELNKMEKIYSEAPQINVDNRSIEIIVASPEGKELTERIMLGEKTAD